MISERGEQEVLVKIVNDPEGDPAILLQLPDGFVLIKRPGDAKMLGASLIEAGDELLRVTTT